MSAGHPPSRQGILKLETRTVGPPHPLMPCQPCPQPRLSSKGEPAGTSLKLTEPGRDLRAAKKLVKDDKQSFAAFRNVSKWRRNSFSLSQQLAKINLRRRRRREALVHFPSPKSCSSWGRRAEKRGTARLSMFSSPFTLGSSVQTAGLERVTWPFAARS